MLFSTLLRCFRPRTAARPTARTGRLAVEALEDRLTPAGTFTVGDVTVVEGNTGTLNALVPVTLRGTHGNNVTVNYTTANGTAAAGGDYTATSGKLTFNKNQTSKTITIPIVGDRLSEAGETFTVLLANPKGATITDGTGVVTIQDNEPRVRIDDPAALEDHANAVTMNFAVTLLAAYDLPVTVGYATGGGSATPGDDYAAATGTVTIPAGLTSQTIPIAVNDDRLLEEDESIQVTLTASDSYATISKGVGFGTIYDNEPRVSIDSYAMQDYYAGSITFYVTLAVPYDEPVTVDFATVDGSAFDGVDYVAASGTLTFAPGETTLWITIELLTVDPDPYKYFTVQLSNPSTNAWLMNDLAYGYWYYDWGW